MNFKEIIELGKEDRNTSETKRFLRPRKVRSIPELRKLLEKKRKN